MSNIYTSYLGLQLKSPFIAASCGITSNIDKAIEIDKAGAGAIVLKSLFEEQISNEADFVAKESVMFPDMADYLYSYMRRNSISEYVKTINSIKQKVSVPVIASINCFQSGEWVEYAKRVEEAGADALELNIFTLPLNDNKSGEEYVSEYRTIVKDVVKATDLPLSVKIGRNFTNIPGFVDKLAGAGAKGVVMFNRFYTPDIDIDKMRVVPAEALSMPYEYQTVLRWIAITSATVRGCDIAASTGFHTPQDAIKALLVGANAVQICSVMLKNGARVFSEFNNYLCEYLDKKGFNSVEELIGRLNYSNIEDPASFERVQFMKVFGNK